MSPRGLRRDRTRSLQLLFLGLLLVSAAQVTWWILDQVLLANRLREELLQHAATDAQAAERLLGTGLSAGELRELFPHVDFGADGTTAVSQAYVETVHDERWRRLHRYGWEGAFFLAVLGAGMFVVARSLRQQARLRRYQENFLAAVSHEFKSPIAGVRLAAETLELRDPDRDDRQRLLGRLLADLDRLEGLVTNLLETSRLEEGAIRLEACQLPLRRIVDEVAVAVRGRMASARGEDVALRIEVDVPDQLEILADPRSVEAVVRNLLDNAVKALPLEQDGSISVQARREGSMVRLTVTDDGSGFPPEKAQRLFEKFYRPGDELRRTRPGTGLGLYLVRRFVELEGGQVSAHSDGPGRGARFEVTWPAVGKGTAS